MKIPLNYRIEVLAKRIHLLSQEKYHLKRNQLSPIGIINIVQILPVQQSLKRAK